MPQRFQIPTTELLGIGNLTLDAIVGVTDIAESLHMEITNNTKFINFQLTGFHSKNIYQSIRLITQLLNYCIHKQLEQYNPGKERQQSTPLRDTYLAILNGIIGDHLVNKKNPLAIPMQFKRNGRPLSVSELTSKLQEHTNNKLIILVHGSCMNHLAWQQQGHDHGIALAQDLKLLPIYLHYNSGLHISHNGKQFSHLLNQFISNYQRPLSLYILAHSMGGLVSRSAYHYGKILDHNWTHLLEKMIFLGTPHHGAILEKGGNWLNNLLSLNRYSAPFAQLGKIRSCGVTDLRFGNIIDEDWQGRDRFQFSNDPRTPIPLPEDVQCYSIAATLNKESNEISEGTIGDGLVTLSSALGLHKNANHNLAFDKDHQWIAKNMGHTDLLHQSDVYKKIQKWLR